jgi:predicted PurR-regulated permease PerM
MRSKSAPLPREEGFPQQLDLHIPLATILKVLLTAVIVWAVIQLLPELFLLLLSLLLAMALSPAAAWAERHGAPRSLAVAGVGAFLLLLFAGFLFLVVPPLTSQISALLDNYPGYRAKVARDLSGGSPFLKQVALQIVDLPSSPEVAASLKRPLAWGRVAILGVTGVALMFILVLYLLLDGRRSYAWVLAYVPRRHRRKMALMLPQVSEVVIGYIQGQILTSLLYGLFALTALSLLHVPAALPLALLAAICDVIPVLGVIVSTIPAALLALTVSPLAAGAVVALYLLYHLLENSLIIPKIYGKRLRLSSLVVLLTLIVGGSLFGIAGAVLVLPVVAAYPIVERIWLQDYLSDDVLDDHSALENAPHGSKERIVKRVLDGEKAPERAEPA